MTTALVLAGKRDGTLDPLASADGVSHKCLIKVAGRTMILYPITALAKSPAIGRIIVSIDEPGVLDGIPEIDALRKEGRLTIVESRHNLVDSVLTAAEGAEFPLLITTADNVLFSSASVAQMDAAARTEQADAAVGFARKEAVLAAHPDGQRKFYKFRCGEYSNCNAYWIGNRDALKAAEVFRSGGQFVKYPKRIIAAFGLINLIRFRYGLGTLDKSFRSFSRRLKLKVRPIIIADGKAAIDVDNERSKKVTEEVLAREATAARA